jgi:hypothetical protein
VSKDFLDLPETWFASVTAKKSTSTPLWLNSQKSFQEALSFFNLIFDSSNKNIDLGIVSSSMTQPFYFTQEAWDAEISKLKYVKTDRFFYPYSPDLGSARNIIIGNYCWKGVGRNGTAVRKELSHASGYLGIKEAIVELYFDLLLKKISPEMRVPVVGVFLYKEFPSAFLVRSSLLLRCSQIPGYLRDADKLEIKRHISTCFDGAPEDQWLLIAVRRCAKLIRRGFYQTSSTRDNITIDGRILDNYSMDYLDSNDEQNITCQVFYSPKFDVASVDTRNLEWLLSDDIELISTPIKFLSSFYFCLMESYSILGIECPKWDEIVSLLIKDTSFPAEFFKFGPTFSDERKKSVHLLFSNLLIGREPVVETRANTIIISTKPRKHDQVSKKIEAI